MRDPDYTKALLEGDIHTVHQIAAGIETRNKAKTFIYAWLLGAGDEKIGTIVGVKSEEIEELITYAKNIKKWGKTLLEIIISGLREKRRKADKLTVCTIIKGYKTKEQFLNRTPALKHLRKVEIPKAAKQGYLVGLDGRKLWIPNEHLAMSLYLQGFEAVIMKKAMVLFNEKLKANNVPYKQVAMVHDEFQVETHKDYGDFVGQTIVESIKIAGELLNSSCPLDGEYKIGTSWAETH
jgi:DNA polymerase I-like protein with 3'-5' exonuclease and polymerase domains